MNKSLKKLSRMELLQLLVKASETNEALVAENDELRRAAAAAPAPERPPVQAAKVGSIAEAALQANGYFEAAQRSADDYLREIKRLRDQVAARAAQAQPADTTGKIAPVQAVDQAQVQQQVREQVEKYRLQLQQQMQDQLKSEHAKMVQQLRAQQEVLKERADALAQQQAALDQQASGVLVPPVVQDAQQQASLMVSQANARVQAMLADARSRSDAMLAEANAKAEEIVADANRQAYEVISQANRRADVLLNAASKGTDEYSTGPLLRKGRHAKSAAAGVQ